MRWMSLAWGHRESRRERHTIGEVAVHGGAGDAQHLRDVGGRDALLPELAGFGGIGVVDLARASALAPSLISNVLSFSNVASNVHSKLLRLARSHLGEIYLSQYGVTRRPHRLPTTAESFTRLQRCSRKPQQHNINRRMRQTT